MIRIYCDACNNVVEGRAYSFEPLLHVCEKGEGRLGGYVEIPLMAATSGRTVKYDLCLPCYNEVHDAAYMAMKEIKRKS